MLNRYILAFLLLLACQSALELTVVAQDPDAQNYRRYALTHQGDPARGLKFFNDAERVGCVRCHSVDGRANKAGPDLFAVGDKFGRGDIIDAILTPSATIATGYSTTTAMQSQENLLKLHEYSGSIKGVIIE